MDKIISILQMLLGSPVGTFAFILSLMLGAGWLIHWVTKKVTEIKTSHEYLQKENEKTNDSLEIHAQKTESKLEHHAEKIDRAMDEIRRDISFLKSAFDIYKTNPPSPLAQSHSPVSLTKKGEEVSEELGAEEMIAKNWDKIYKALEEDVCDKNAYDIQQYCMETSTVELEKFLDPESIEKIKLYAYKAGMPMAYYAPIFGIPIRDKYLERKGISVEEVDKNDPHRS
ncbi:MAG: hypothetical protein K6F72_00670 [Bacteroidales bacterium]|nr:hypothetical protein [Bacteroidales bacterium]